MHVASTAAVVSRLLLLSTATAKTIDVKIDPTPKQTLVSFGASGAWWPNDLILFPEKQQHELARFLFSSDGMHLSSYRYNVGGDGGSQDAQRVVAGDTRVESFLLHNGTYDWSRDRGGVTFLQHAQSRHVPAITFFANAAPAAIATNGAACGWNLTADKIDAYAGYLDRVLSHWTRNGIDIRYVSPVNEPDNDRSSCTQEGMAVDPSLRAPLVEAIRKALDSGSARSVGIIADETSQISTQALPEDPYWLPHAAPYMSNIAVHNYDYPSDAQLAQYYEQISSLTRNERQPSVKFTETCCSTNAGHGSTVFGAQYDPGMTNALIVARYVWQFLTIAQAVSFDWWTAVANLPCSPKLDGPSCAEFNQTAGYNSGLVYIDPQYKSSHDYTFYYTKRAFMLKHLAYFHRPGSVRYDIAQDQFPYDINAIASKRDAVWNVLFMNHGNATAQISLQLPEPKVKLTRVVETTEEKDFEDVKKLPHVDDGKVAIALSAQSLVTLQFNKQI